jgi:hypothetical protein
MSVAIGLMLIVFGTTVVLLNLDPLGEWTRYCVGVLWILLAMRLRYA